MSLFDGLGGGGGGGGIIGQTLGLTRGSTVAPQNVPSAPVNQGNTTPQSFGQAVASQINTIGCIFKPCLPPNQTVAQKTLNNRQTELSSYLCCITGIDQFQQSCIQELMMNDRKLIRQGGVQPPQGNLSQIGVGMGQPTQPGAPTALGGGGLFGGGAPNAAVSFPGGTTTAGGGLFGGGGATIGGGGLFGGGAQATQPGAGGMFGGQTTNQPAQGGLFGGQPTQPQATGGLFGGATQAPQTGGLFGGAPTTQAGGLFGGQVSQPTGGGGLFGATAPAAGGGLFGGAPAAQQGGLFGGAQQNKGGLFGTTPQTTGGGLFGQTSQPQVGGGLFGQPQFQGQQQQQQGFKSVNEMIEEIGRIEQAKAFSQNKQKEQENKMNGKFATDKNHINHINYLKSQQQKRNVLQWYTLHNKNANKFIEAPYTVKVNVNWENIKRNEWQILQRSQDIKNQTFLNMGGEQRMMYSPQNYNNNTLLYNQLRQLERASSKYTNKSLAIKQQEYNKEQLETFSQTNYFKNTIPVNPQMDQDKMFSENDESNKLNENSIQYLYEQSLKNTIKVFDTTVSLKISEDHDHIIIPLQVKSTSTISYLLTLVFDYLEDNYNINPEKLDIYHSNYVLYQPLEIEHLLQVRKDRLISEIETSQQGQIGNFEIVYLDPSEVDDVENEDDQIEEEDDYFGNSNQQNIDYLPTVPDGYSIEPNLQELMTKSMDQLRRFKNFKIRNQYAEICFEGEIDLIRRDFSSELIIKENEIIIYPYQSEDQPQVQPGYGINVKSTIKRFNAAKLLLQNERFDIQKIERKIRKIANEYKMEIVEPYNPQTDSFTVRVLHFSK